MRLTVRLVPLAVAALGGCTAMTVQQTGFTPTLVIAAPPAPAPKPIEKIAISSKIQFELGKATLKKASFKVLDEVVAVLQGRPGVRKVQIEGHTDITGDPQKNRELSQARAESVLEYLVTKGVARERLVARGFGPDKPIAPNETEEGREANRRVEFAIIEQDGN
jgi:OOP family OmpA-OmpF porin